MAELIDGASSHDPIARQFVPDAAELHVLPEERADPIGDHAHSPVEGVVHRYPDRALLKLTRVHTRIPVVDPARITPELARALKAQGKATYVVLHANHARELTDAARQA